MKSLGEHLALRYMIEPAGIRPDTIYYDEGTARVVFPAFAGKADRIVFMRGDILMAWTFTAVESSGGDLTVEFNLP